MMRQFSLARTVTQTLKDLPYSMHVELSVVDHALKIDSDQLSRLFEECEVMSSLMYACC